MGNIQAYINYNSELQFTENLNEQIINCGSVHNQIFGNVQLWKIKKNYCITLFSFTRHLYHLDSTLFAFHQERCTLNHKNLLTYYACSQNPASFCGNIESQSFYFEYVEKTMSKILITRSEPLSEIEIWKIIEQLTNVLSYLQLNNKCHGNICLENIYITNENEIKILDSMKGNLTDIQLKQDIYDLGLVLLELMTKKKYHMNVKDTVLSLQGQYTQQLLQFLAIMLNNNPEKRPDFIELNNLQKNRFRNTTSRSPDQKKLIKSNTISVLQNYPTIMSRQQIKSFSPINKQQIMQNHISRSPQKVTIIYSPTQDSKLIQKEQNQNIITRIQYQQRKKQQVIIPNTYSPQKKKLNRSQASTITSFGISINDNMNKTNSTNYNIISNRELLTKPTINVQQHQSLIKQYVSKDDLNKTQSSIGSISIMNKK